MKTIKRIILIVLLMVLCGAGFLLNPMVRFILCLSMDRFENADAVYRSFLCASEGLNREANLQINRFAERCLVKYYYHQIDYSRVMDIFSALSKTGFPPESIDGFIHDANEMESARAIFASANDCYSRGDFANAVILYRKSLIADDSALDSLKQAETDYKNQLLDKAEKAMGTGEFFAADSMLCDGIVILGADKDLECALSDLRHMESDQTMEALVDNTYSLLSTHGPGAAFRYIADLRIQTPDSYELEYFEQSFLHEYEDKICKSVALLQNEGKLSEACSVLEEALDLIESEKIKTLYTQVRQALPCLIGDMPVLTDETGDPRTGEESTIRKDQFHTDSFSNKYTHSYSADIGTVSFPLQGAFSSFTGTLAFPDGEKSDVYRSSAAVSVYGDGILIAEFKTISVTTAPITFSIPLDGVQVLQLIWTCEGANGWKDWGRFATIFDGTFLY